MEWVQTCFTHTKLGVGTDVCFTHTKLGGYEIYARALLCGSLARDLLLAGTSAPNVCETRVRTCIITVEDRDRSIGEQHRDEVRV